MELQERLKKNLKAKPQIHPSVYTHKTAALIGNVKVAKNASIWPQAVLRGDINAITIGEGTNIQDGCILHLADDFPCIVGNNVTLGHGAIIHACTIEDQCLIGMHATILDGAHIAKNCIIGAQALITQSTHIPEGSLVLGSPGKVVRKLTKAEIQSLQASADKYIQTAQFYKEHDL